MKGISRIDHVSIAVRDPEKAGAFFVMILGAIPGCLV
jgi:catechol 2,3-dioxygenase-like lactoylglutathione lyase family enzyme